jgi:hypothetical protein
MTQLPVACTLSEPLMAKRRAGLFADLARRRQETRWLPEGVALRYTSEPGTLALLGEFIQLERQCCPFLHSSSRWSLRAPSGSSWPVRLAPEPWRTRSAPRNRLTRFCHTRPRAAQPSRAP